MFYMILLALIYGLILGFLVINKIYVKTSAMATIMAIGIITKGVAMNYFGSNDTGEYGKILTIVIFALWMSFTSSYILSAINKRFRDIHLRDPINRFGMGTWIAGTSICTILFYKQFPEWAVVVKIMFALNMVFWIFYISICLGAFHDLRKVNNSKKIHGIILLTTVSTQSLVLSMNTIFNNIPKVINLSMITIGIILYFISASLIIKRYILNRDTFSVDKDWYNTNSILHGALSITGLACLFLNHISEKAIVTIWICTFLIFVFIEFLEVYRLITRVRSYGVRKGIFVYDLTQWSRLFTFGMFYTFTFLLANNLDLHHILLSSIVNSGIWLILMLLLIEIGLSLTIPYEILKIKKATKNQVKNSFL